jgi:hypothetical protein
MPADVHHLPPRCPACHRPMQLIHVLADKLSSTSWSGLIGVLRFSHILILARLTANLAVFASFAASLARGALLCLGG